MTTKENRKMKNLMGTLTPVSLSNYESSKEFFRDNKYHELFTLIKKFGLETDSEIRKIWVPIRRTRMQVRAQYNKIPNKVRQDNKNSINWGNGRGNANKIRYPKKCRKTAWKRFYKLFPHLNSKLNLN